MLFQVDGRGCGKSVGYMALECGWPVEVPGAARLAAETVDRSAQEKVLPTVSRHVIHHHEERDLRVAYGESYSRRSRS